MVVEINLVNSIVWRMHLWKTVQFTNIVASHTAYWYSLFIEWGGRMKEEEERAQLSSSSIILYLISLWPIDALLKQLALLRKNRVKRNKSDFRLERTHVISIIIIIVEAPHLFAFRPTEVYAWINAREQFAYAYVHTETMPDKQWPIGWKLKSFFSYAIV